ncbi:MAG: prephenate dehydrogenase/arogenate dehydrogenase family protein [Acidobacteria bacterium]|nr:prephenate dehydrogenase/arogenate dehydrogenase family protein [Acidobacteriota bacterium]MBV9475204.1 prephenate dehydrogenase/arogenate dehydrogenase family protein [Acidobacteriota bacterium]
MPREALIVGLGLIGGSAGIALRARDWRVRYVDPNVALEDALAKQAAHERVDAIDDASDVIVFATPIDAAVRELATLRARCIVTSTCSAMRALRALARTPFVAGHPMAGSHEQGLAAAHGNLFREKRWFVDGDNAIVDELIRDCGATRDKVDAETHDAAVALTSHLPQVLSTALAAYLQGQSIDPRFVGSGLRDFLRLAGSPASMWAPLLAANGDNIAPHAEGVARIVRSMLESGDAMRTFEDARAFWRTL